MGSKFLRTTSVMLSNRFTSHALCSFFSELPLSEDHHHVKIWDLPSFVLQKLAAARFKYPSKKKPPRARASVATIAVTISSIP